MTRHFLQTHDQPERLFDHCCLAAWHGLDVMGCLPFSKTRLTLQWQAFSGQRAVHAGHALKIL